MRPQTKTTTTKVANRIMVMRTATTNPSNTQKIATGFMIIVIVIYKETENMNIDEKANDIRHMFEARLITRKEYGELIRKLEADHNLI